MQAPFGSEVHRGAVSVRLDVRVLRPVVTRTLLPFAVSLPPWTLPDSWILHFLLAGAPPGWEHRPCVPTQICPLGHILFCRQPSCHLAVFLVVQLMTPNTQSEPEALGGLQRGAICTHWDLDTTDVQGAEGNAVGWEQIQLR